MSARTACIKRGGCPTSIDFQEFEFDHMRRAVFSCGECEQTTEIWQQSGESVNALPFRFAGTAFIVERNRTACARLPRTPHTAGAANESKHSTSAVRRRRVSATAAPPTASVGFAARPFRTRHVRFRSSEAPPCRIPWTTFSNGAAARDSLAAGAAFQVRVQRSCCGWRVDLCLCLLLSASLSPQSFSPVST